MKWGCLETIVKLAMHCSKRHNKNKRLLYDRGFCLTQENKLKTDFFIFLVNRAPPSGKSGN